jgi:spermidine synthase
LSGRLAFASKRARDLSVKAYKLIDEGKTPDGGDIKLYEHDGNHVIRVNGHELMSTRTNASERALSEFAIRPLVEAEKKNLKILIGGLGFGFTLKAALPLLPDDAEVTVAELLPAVVRWNKDERWNLSTEALADPRVTVSVKNVLNIIKAKPQAWDAILLDVDNGPCAFTVSRNDRLYDDRGVRQIREALKPGGVLGVWSASPHPPYRSLLERMGFTVRFEKVRANGTSGPNHTLYFGRL